MICIGKGCQIDPTAQIGFRDGSIGDRTIIGKDVVIEGNYVEIGAESFIDAYAWIGGGSCFDEQAFLKAGDWLHMGRYSHINTARGVTIGHEFGCGLGTRVFTHGAYQSVLDGFPAQWESVTIGNNVWMPNAWVNPGVTIGDNVVVAALSLVNKPLPAGCLAGGVPCKVIKENCYPAKLDELHLGIVISKIFQESVSDEPTQHNIIGLGSSFVIDDKTTFDFESKSIVGQVTNTTEAFKNQLRRNGIRFRYIAKEMEYAPWDLA